MQGIMTMHELQECIRSCGFACMTGYDEEIDPIHYLVFVRTGSERKRVAALVNGRRVEWTYPLGRIVKVVQLDEAISRKWVDDMFANSTLDDAGIRVMAHEDLMLWYLVNVLTQYANTGWVGLNVLMHYGADRSNMDGAYRALFEHMSATGHRVKLSRLKYLKRNFIRYSMKYRTLSLWNVPSIVWGYLVNSMLASKSRRVDKKHDLHAAEIMKEHSKTVPAFMKFLADELKLPYQYEILNEKPNGYGCSFVRAGDLFIKGNETSYTNTFMNEVNAQKKLSALPEESRKLFICMKGFCDKGRTFIVYPFVRGVILESYYKREGRLTSDELRELGVYLVNVVEALYTAGVVHRDLTIWNVMYTPDEDSKFKLGDFGCAYSGGADVLSSDAYRDARNKRSVGGYFRYDQDICDDAAAAYSVYLFCGGSPDDECALRLRSVIGRCYKD